MTKNKLKLSLIDDYIKIVLIKNFLNNNFDSANLNSFYSDLLNKSKTLDCFLEKIYNLMFEKLRLNNISLDILKQDLVNNNNQFERENKLNFINCGKIIEQSNSDLNYIRENLKFKLEKLKININTPLLM